MAREIDSYWTSSAAEREHRRGLVRLLDPERTRETTALEIGCGTGLVAQEILASDCPIREYVGLDISWEMLRIARTRLPLLPFLLADGEHVPFPDGRFDLVFAFEVLGHLPRLGGVLSEMARLANDCAIFTLWTSSSGTKSEVHEDGFIWWEYEPREVEDEIMRAFGDKCAVKSGLLNGIVRYWKVNRMGDGRCRLVT